eukprot:m.178285 g.178285  ORF g.178285 m.178285 type:complete len:69 (-) comp17979_c2_seq3:1395-1601(-)
MALANPQPEAETPAVPTIVCTRAKSIVATEALKNNKGPQWPELVLSMCYEVLCEDDIQWSSALLTAAL